ncbi:MAG TPA: hypothetical protein VEL07_18095 [Planctomycetota bacterium]|nr:hypothetical protein [Planctomycetota bacterium]
MPDATAIAAHTGGLANAYRAALIAAPPDVLGASAARSREEAMHTTAAVALRALDGGSAPWASSADEDAADDFARLLRARARPSDATTDAQSRAFADAETALAAGRIATRSLMALFGGSASDDHSDGDHDLFGMDMGMGAMGDDGMASMFDGFVADIDAQIGQVLKLARQRRDALLTTATAEGVADALFSAGQRAVRETRRAG